MKVTTVGLDLAKNVFQIHAVDHRGKVMVRKQLKRDQVAPFFAKLEPCLVTRYKPEARSNLPAVVAAVALANKNARIAWALLARQELPSRLRRRSGLTQQRRTHYQIAQAITK